MRRFKEPIKAMKDRLSHLRADLRRYENNPEPDEIRSRLRAAIKLEIEQFESAIEYLESSYVQDKEISLEEKDRIERLRHFGGEPYDR